MGRRTGIISGVLGLWMLTCPSANAGKFSDCAKQAMRSGTPVGDCIGGSPNSGPPTDRSYPRAGGGEYVPAPGQATSQAALQCDISREPKRYGDWSFNACTVPRNAGLQAGHQCGCRSAATGMTYGGVVVEVGGGYSASPTPGAYGQTAQPDRASTCDVSMEPKPQGDWSLQSCAIRGASTPPGVQCTCRSQATGRIYGGVAR